LCVNGLLQSHKLQLPERKSWLALPRFARQGEDIINRHIGQYGMVSAVYIKARLLSVKCKLRRFKYLGDTFAYIVLLWWISDPIPLPLPLRGEGECVFKRGLRPLFLLLPPPARRVSRG